MTSYPLDAGVRRELIGAEGYPLPIARRAIEEIFGPAGQRSFDVRYWTGDTEAGGGETPARFTLVLHGPGALRRALLPPSKLALGEAFVRGDLDVEGDLEAAGDLAAILAARLSSPRRLGRVLALLLRLPREPAPMLAGPLRRARRRWSLPHTRRRDAAAIRHHYDVGNDFYRLWLDAETVYSCGYFPPGVDEIDTAQRAKLDYICRKLRLRPGERFLDIGCGWGGLIRHAARHYGVQALGITLSPAQAQLAQQRILADGLGDCCRVEVRDYRDLPPGQAFDKAASVGMFEHVGRSRLPRYFEAVFGALRPGGLFLNHGIIDLEEARRPRGVRLTRALWRDGGFVRRYVFPDGELVPLAEAVGAAEAEGFETRDAESLREHYVLTLRHWVRRLEARQSEAVALVGEPTFRVWRVYLALSAHGFASGKVGLVQLLLAKPGAAMSAALPLTRHDLYRDASYVAREASR